MLVVFGTVGNVVHPVTTFQKLNPVPPEGWDEQLVEEYPEANKEQGSEVEGLERLL